jgi:hypothetical protein
MADLLRRRTIFVRPDGPERLSAVMNVPEFLTVVEAARVLRIGRTVAYEQAARYEATGGAEGLPVMRIGRQMRVPRALLERRAGVPITTVDVDLRSSVSAPLDGGKVEDLVVDEAQQPALPFSA